jgi:hypothetical protein
MITGDAQYLSCINKPKPVYLFYNRYDQMTNGFNMKASMMREMLFHDISQITDEKVPEIFDFFSNFRFGLGKQISSPEKILKPARSREEMSEKESGFYK